jgi:hypothetical protein
VSQSVALPAFRDRSGAGGVSVVKAPLSGGQSRTPGWRSHERARLAFGLEAGRVGAGGSAWVRGKLCMAVGRRACPSRQLRRRSTSWSSSVSDYTSSTLAPSRWKQIDWRLCTGNVNLLKLGGRPARPLSTFAPAGRLLCSCRSALLSPFGGSATRFPDWTLRPRVSAPVTHHHLDSFLASLIADAQNAGFFAAGVGSLVGAVEAA